MTITRTAIFPTGHTPRIAATKYSDDEAKAQLKQRIKSGQITGDYAISLSRRRSPLTKNQMAWVHITVCKDDAS